MVLLKESIVETGISLIELYCHSLVALSLLVRVVQLRYIAVIRRTTATGPTGIYRCDIPTIAVHDDNDISVRETVYVGLYPTDGM